MSRVGKTPIELPKGVSVKIENNKVTIKGPKGELVHPLPKGVDAVVEQDQLSVVTDSNVLKGTTRAVLANCVAGVDKGWSRKLQLVGIGYRAQVSQVAAKKDEEDESDSGSGSGSSRFKVDLTLGLSHPVSYIAPRGIELQCPSQTEIIVLGTCKALVGQVAADIRGICKGVRKPEPYKGKGIRYSDERILIKETKKKK